MPDNDLYQKISLFGSEDVRLWVRRTVADSKEYQDLRRAVGYDLQNAWKEAVSGRMLPGMTYRVDSASYRDAIDKPYLIPARNGNDGGVRVPLAGADPAKALALAQRIEAGHGRIDMKPKLLAGGTPLKHGSGTYTIVPFEHSREGSEEGPRDIPIRFQALLKRREAGRQPAFRPRLKAEKRPYGTSRRPHMNYGRRRNVAGYRSKYGTLSGLTGSEPFEQVVAPGRTGKIQHDAGYQQDPDAGYRTFRTVSSKSDPNSWMLPAKPPNPILSAVVAEVMQRWGAF